MVPDAVLALMLVVPWLRARPSARQRRSGLLAVIVPGALYGAFLLVQKHQNGWYLYPSHASQVNFHWGALETKLQTGCKFVFVEQGRLAWSVLVGLWALLRGFGRRVGEPRWRRSLAWTFAGFIAAYLVFSAGNVFMKRYLLCLLSLLVVLAGRVLYELAGRQTRVLAPAVAGLALLSLGQLASPYFNCAFDMSFRQSVLVQKQATSYREATVASDRPILANLPVVFGLEDPRLGYVPKRFSRSSYRYSPDDEYIFAEEIYERFAPPPGAPTRLLKRFASPSMTIALYRIVR